MSFALNPILLNAIQNEQIYISNDNDLVVTDKASNMVLKQLVADKFIKETDLNKKHKGKFYLEADWRMPMDRYEKQLEGFRKAIATQKIKNKYKQIGDKSSKLGLPLHEELGVKKIGNAYTLEYRGGRIQFMDNKVEATVTSRIEIWWTGLRCLIRQESGLDEVYGSVSLIVPGNGLSKTENFPDRSIQQALYMGEDGPRLVPTQVLLYDGPPMNISLACTLSEMDSGDKVEQYKQQVSEFVSKAASALGAMAGIPAEGAASSQSWIGEVTSGLVGIAFDCLGEGDDPYTPGTLGLRWEELANENYTRRLEEGDGNTIQYTHTLVLNGVDDGGDKGAFAFYFDVRTFIVQGTNI